MAYNIDLFGDGHSFELVIIDEGVAVIKRWEKFMPRRYKDAHKKGFKWAIGYGHVEGGHNWPFEIPEDMEITEPQAHDIFKADLESKAAYVRSVVKVPLNTFQFNALISLVFNIGEGNFGQNPAVGDFTESRVLTLLNQERYTAAGAAFIDHNRAWVDMVERDKNDLPILDANGKEKLILDSEGKAIKELRVVNGLTIRRGVEMELFSRKVMKQAA